MILLENVSKQSDGDRYVVRDVSLRLPAGAMIVLLGGSGCGKTTTLKMINRLIEPTSGPGPSPGDTPAVRRPRGT